MYYLSIPKLNFEYSFAAVSAIIIVGKKRNGKEAN